MAPDSDYSRGVRDGEIHARLEDHGRRLDAVNGTIARTGDKLAELTDAIRSIQLSRTVSLKKWQVAAGVLTVISPEVLHLLGVG